MFASFPALKQYTHMIGVVVLKLLNTISASMSELKRAPWEHVLVQVLGRWVEGNGDQEMFNISETLHKCPRTKDTCQVLAACYTPVGSSRWLLSREELLLAHPRVAFSLNVWSVFAQKEC